MPEQPMPPERPPRLSSARPHQIAALLLHMTIVVIFGILALCSIGGGIYAIVANAQSHTELSLLGASLNTGHVGVAFIGIGPIIAFFTVRSVLKNQHELAALPLDETVPPPNETTSRRKPRKKQ